MNVTSFILPLLASCFLSASAGVGWAQSVSDLASSGADAVLTRLFGEHKAFTADAVLRVYNKEEKEVLSAAMGYAFREGKVRMEMDMTGLRISELPDGLAGGLKQVGMDKVVSLILPEARTSYLIYPGLESVLKVPLSQEALKEHAAEFTLQRQRIGTETLDGQACVKYRVTVTDSAGATQQAVTWNAIALQEFPVQLQLTDGDHLVIFRFRNVKLVAPDSALFTVPSGYTEYDGQQALMQAVMRKALEGIGGQ